MERYLGFDVAVTIVIASEMAKFTGVTPPTFHGHADEDADGFLRSFERYTKFREITDNNKKLNLFGVLLHDAAAQWLDGVPDSEKDSFDNLFTRFSERYRLPESQKFKCANDLFSHQAVVFEKTTA